MDANVPGEQYSRETQTSQISGEELKHHVPKILLVGVVLILLLILLLVWYTKIAGFIGVPQGQQSTSQNLNGLLVLAVAAKSSDSTKARIFPMGYDFSNDQLIYEPVDKLVASPDGVNLAYQHVFSGNGRFITFVGATDIAGVSTFTDIPMQIYRADVSVATSSDNFTHIVQSAQQITNGTGTVKQSPSVSNNGDVLYIAHASEEPSKLFSSQASEWDVHLVKNDTDRILTKGIYPKWVSNDKFVYLKDDGLYLYDLRNARGAKVWGAEGLVTMTMNLDVSDDSQYVAWVAPDAGGVYILRALNWEDDNTLTLKGIITAPATHAVFSPDDKFVALEIIVPGDTVGESKPAITYYDVNTRTPVSSPLVLNMVDPNQTYLTDWQP